jgi:hypothetical protein
VHSSYAIGISRCTSNEQLLTRALVTTTLCFFASRLAIAIAHGQWFFGWTEVCIDILSGVMAAVVGVWNLQEGVVKVEDMGEGEIQSGPKGGEMEVTEEEATNDYEEMEMEEGELKDEDE